MKIFKTLLLSIMLITSTVISANDTNTENVNILDKSKCAINKESGLVNSIDFTICPDDIVFRALHGSFTSIFEDYIFDIVDYDYLNDVSNIDYKNLSQAEINSKTSELAIKKNKSKIVEVIFQVLWHTAFVLIMIFSVMKIIKTVFRSMQNGDHLNEEINAKVCIWWLFGALMLMPVGNVFVINILFLIFILAAIAPANFIYGFFIFGISTLFNPAEVNDLALKLDNTDHSYYFSAEKYENLVNGHICKTRTTNMLLSNNLELNYDVLDQNIKCQLPENKISYSLLNNTPLTGFYNYDISTSQTNYVDKTNMFNELTLKQNNQKCEVDRSLFTMEKFDCLNIKAPYVINNDNILIKHLIKDEFLLAIKNTIPLLNNDEPDVFRIVAQYQILKDQIYAKALDKEQEIINRSANDVISYNENQLLNIVRDINSGIENQQLIEITNLFYQALLNHIEIGTIIFDKELVNNSVIRNITYQNTEISDKYLAMAQKASDYLLDLECLMDQEEVAKTKNFISQSSNPLKSLNCFNPSNRSVPFGFIELDGSEDGRLKIIERMMEIKADIEKNKSEFIISHSTKRKVIDSALHRSLIILNNDSVKNNKTMNLIQARQEGFMSFSRILMNIAEYQIDTTQFIRNLNNSINIGTFMNSYNKIDILVDDKYKQSPIYDNFFKLSEITEKHLSDYKVLFKGNKYVDFKSNSSIMDEKTTADNESNIAEMVNRINPIKPILDAIGAKSITSDKPVAMLCSEDINECPIPAQSPIHGLNQAGVDYLNYGTGILTAVISIQAANYLIVSNSEKKVKNGTDGNAGKQTEINNRKSNKKSKANSTKGKGKISGKGLGMLSGFIELIASMAVLAAGYMIVLGVLLTFGLPLYAFLFMFFNFMAWFMMSVQTLFTLNFTITSVAINEDNRPEILKYLFNNLMSIFLKPSLIIVSMIFLYSFLSVMFFFLNLTVSSVFEGIKMTKMTVLFIDMSFIQTGIFALLLLFVIFQFIRHSYKIVIDMYEKVFQLIGIASRSNDSSGVIDNIIGFQLLETAIEKVQGFGKAAVSSVSTKGKIQSMDERRELIEKVVKGEDFDYNGFKVNSKEFKVTDSQNKTFTYTDVNGVIKKITT